MSAALGWFLGLLVALALDILVFGFIWTNASIAEAFLFGMVTGFIFPGIGMMLAEDY